MFIEKRHAYSANTYNFVLISLKMTIVILNNTNKTDTVFKYILFTILFKLFIDLSVFINYIN